MSDTTTAKPAAPPADTEHPHRYTAALANEIEERWQRVWEEQNVFATPNPGEPGFNAAKPKFYVLDMFPYPSGSGLHVGHPEGYTATDIVARFKRMQGCNVLHPMGWDAFGLPAEQYAVQTNVHPAITTREAIETFRSQLKRFGFSYDWSREFATIDPDYYRWTQWIWLKAYDSWYDPMVDRARPIAELVNDMENGNAYVGPDGELVRIGIDGDMEVLTGEPVGCRKWHELEPDERREFIDSQRLAYIDEQTVNWCPKLGTVLANEEVIDGRSERGGYPVHRQPLRQWMFRITAFADRLLADLELLNWPESTKTMQTEWIGRSVGAEIDFEIAESENSDLKSGIPAIRVFTTRPDTIFGATYMVLAPEHPLVSEILSEEPHDAERRASRESLREYVKRARSRTDVERQESREKTGVNTGVHAVNPATGERIPVWVADYVLSGYGHGAIMAVPAHDERDFDFARKFGLDIVKVVEPAEDESGQWASNDANGWEAPYSGEGTAVNSSNDEVSLDGLPTEDARDRITEWLEQTGRGRAKVNYKLRDWLFSRQRYWGEPFPVVFDEQGNHYPIAAENLPVTLPELEDFRPIESQTPTPPLSKATDWVNTTAGEAGVSPDILPPDTPVRRETNTMPNWAGSCWYYLRFCDPRNDERFVGGKAEAYWMTGATKRRSDEATKSEEKRVAGVDLYIGGSEHAVLHLLYARFWHKILFDLGYVSTPEPFGWVFHQGLIVSHAYQRADRTLVPVDEVEERAAGQVSDLPGGSESRPTESATEYVEIATGERVEPITAKMSKSLKNVVNPDDVIVGYGADTFRLYEMYMGPLEASKPWNTRDIAGCYRFLQRVWRLAVDESSGASALAESPSEAVERQLHRTIAKVGADIERLSFNTAIASMMEFVNVATSEGGVTANQMERFALVLAPFAPHVAEELWYRLGQTEPLAYASWPEHDDSMLVEDEIEIPVQVMGKVRARIRVPADADRDAVEQAAMNDPGVQAHLEGKAVRKVIYVPGKILNIVAN